MPRVPDTKIVSLDHVVPELARKSGRVKYVVECEAADFVLSEIANLYFRDTLVGGWRPLRLEYIIRPEDVQNFSARSWIAATLQKVGVDQPTFSTLKRLGSFFPKISDVGPPKTTAAKETAFKKHLAAKVRAGWLPRQKADVIDEGMQDFNIGVTAAIRAWRKEIPASCKRRGRKSNR
jgi:hypothetical protein